jgi:2-oxoglutarate dehydrogenase E1 component
MAERTAKKLPGLQRPTAVEKVIICSGKVFYHLYHRRTALQLENVSFIRLEQVAPFPFELMARAIHRFPKAGEDYIIYVLACVDRMLMYTMHAMCVCIFVELVWVQEEPRNMGAWSYVKPRFDTVLREKKFPQNSIR